ncbi:MAG: phosphate-binding protein [Zetaproteobacteria bacterium CG12_big_fil_rev_8_21_14_0_65_54_13]|nr:MAG: phosphate-binding protein [Zetaproteobacteria bacterium CG23_combo_of_CG06-09_8_20_14_all_54_7]PIW44138.1 MAG: phosphate-binding protein [Zetaproteobacteria bacterium CG12_big_fil_rev_8_21_14_0_65_54_13]PIX55407.1 MAG: phosphate-binding protein [Zetaproteobacteria bacterium CG_4_10_14_3_um_filter_54_28]PJA29099.1 MAG: phosphate-binding protein [Zetaproteobacteria bacterium CG_4_9_14_3_um_filter_54_145]
MKKKIILTAAMMLLAAGTAEARDQIKIVGSSTVYPFSSYTAEALGATTNFKTPVVESTGSGGGMKLFCAGNDLDTPDITNASRRMKAKEFSKCQKNGVKYITEMVVGYDGIAIAQSKEAAAIDLTRKELLLAVASKVPNKDESGLIDNPYHYWDEINAKMPHRKITIYGPPTSSGTRDAFEDMILKHNTKHWKVYNDAGFKKFHEIRQDGVYVPSGENDNLIVQKMTKDTTALGIFGYSYLAENADKIGAATIEGIAPAPVAVQNGSYKLSRSLYFYIKQSHIKKVPGMLEYANLFMSEQMIGDKGECAEIGLIPLPTAMRDEYRASLKSLKRLTADDFKKK